MFVLIIQAYSIQELVFPLTSLLLIYLLLQLPDLHSDWVAYPWSRLNSERNFVCKPGVFIAPVSLPLSKARFFPWIWPLLNFVATVVFT